MKITGEIEKILLETQKNLEKARINKNAEKYWKEIIVYSCIATIIAWITAVLLTQEIMLSAILAFTIFILGIALGYYFPLHKKNLIAGEIEKELPFALMSMAVELNMNLPFEKALKNASKRNYGILSKELERAAREISLKGASIQEALLHLSERIDSRNLKRSIAHLVSVNEQGSRNERGEPIKRIAKELLSKQRAEAKEFSGKLIILSLLFIAVSAIIPAMFQAFVSIGSMFLAIEFTPIQIIIISAVVFPAIDLAILYLVKFKTPVFLRE